VRASGSMNLDPAAEHDPSAVQMDFNGSGIDLESLAPYLGSPEKVDFFRSGLGELRLVGRMTGAHSAPMIRFNAQTGDGGTQCLMLLSRDRAALRLRSPALEASASVLTEFPAFEVQKAVRTQEEAAVVGQPQYNGGMITANARRAEVMPLLRVLRGEGVDVQLPEGSGSTAAGESERAEVSGSLRLRLHEFGDAQDMPFQQCDARRTSQRGALKRDFLGNLEVRGARVNQLQVLSGVEGSVAVMDGRLKVDAVSRGGQERLLVDLDIGSIAQAATNGAVDPDALLATASSGCTPRYGEGSIDGQEDVCVQEPVAIVDHLLQEHVRDVSSWCSASGAHLGLERHNCNSTSSTDPTPQPRGLQNTAGLSGDGVQAFEGVERAVQLQAMQGASFRPSEISGGADRGTRQNGASMFELQHGSMQVKAEADAAQQRVCSAA
jgi:DNA-binding NarL/FixJ family response regulator